LIGSFWFNSFSASAPASAADYELISTTVLGSSASSVTFSSLNTVAAAYKHLQIRWTAIETSGGDVDSLYMRFNGDTAANYAYHRLSGINSSISSAAGSSTSLPYIGFTTGLGYASYKFASGIIDISDFASTSKTKTSRALSGAVGTTDKGVSMHSSLWNNTAAITSITINSGTGNIDVNSRFSLYGLKG